MRPTPDNTSRPECSADAAPPDYATAVQSTAGSPALLAPEMPPELPPRNSLGQSRFFASTSSLSLTSSHRVNTEGKRRLLLIYIHGFIGSEESFYNFPKHVHNLLSIALSETHIVYTKIYPRYKTRGPVHITRDNFSQWLAPHEAPDLDVILLGHSLGGIIAGDVALMPSGRSPSAGFNHRILGLINFDVPFLGLHPRVVATGIGRMFHRSHEQATKDANAQTLPDESSSPDTTFNPAFKNDVNLTKWKGWDGTWHFLSKYSHHLSRSVLQYAYSYYDHAGCMNNYPELIKRHKRLLQLEAVDELSQDYQPAVRGERRVRFVNYFTKSTGVLKHDESADKGVSQKSVPPVDNTLLAANPEDSLAVDNPKHVRSASAPDAAAVSSEIPDVEKADPGKAGEETQPRSSAETSPSIDNNTARTTPPAKEDDSDATRASPQPGNRHFCYIPSETSRGEEQLWVPVHMDNVDEITAHQSIFLPHGTYYDLLVGDTVARIEGWVRDDLTMRAILNDDFEK
ncbi:hypothetical protein BDV25DRAFT_77242 [Aspergillus avenaceus]|uniref:DUF676 domain-containing protein n=1 Tax=Aspergillus avenaceus TaxID=36643 RepID=A0A5N6TFG0_ASPAV|nr:hypothetical protein BDV25DRAFT_77242 [Aspergillus avenaceus]